MMPFFCYSFSRLASFPNIQKNAWNLLFGMKRVQKFCGKRERMTSCDKNRFYCSYFIEVSEQLNIHDYELMKIFFDKKYFY